MKLSEAELCPPELLQGQEEAFERDIQRLGKGPFVEVACPACGMVESRVEFSKWGFRYKRCRFCQTIYMSPRPSEKAMAAYYADSENYRYWAEHIFPASEDARREKVHRPRVEWIRRLDARRRAGWKPHVEVYQDGGRLIEIGPGFGTFALLASEHFDVSVIEPTPELADACRKRGLEVVDGAKNYADVVCAFEVIEHVYDPSAFLADCRKMLKRHGLLVLTCPNSLGFDISLLGADSLAIDPEHVNLFNIASLAMLVQLYGFKLVEVKTPGRLDAEFVRDAILANDYQPDSFLQRVLVDEWDRLGEPFQDFLAEHRLSSHMWLVAQRN